MFFKNSDSANIKGTINFNHNLKLRLIFKGIFIGIWIGFVIVFYRICITFFFKHTLLIYDKIHEQPILILPWIIFLLLVATIISLMMKKEPMISGSGIPHVKGVLAGFLNLNWFRVLSFKFITSLLASGSGLSLGHEGPSIQLGGMIGQGYCRVGNKSKTQENYLITSGASAGLAAAFNAPFSAVIFCIEELQKNFSPIVISSALAASITSDFVARLFLPAHPILSLGTFTHMPVNQYYHLILLGLIVGVLGFLFNKSIILTQKVYSKIKIKKYFLPYIAFAFSVPIGFLIPEALSSGAHILGSNIISMPLKIVIAILVVKYFFTLICFGSTTPGGIFVPILVLGALIGLIYAKIGVRFFNIPDIYLINFTIFAMAGFFCSIVKAPITACILITEMTGRFSSLLPISIVCISSYLISEFLKNEGLYDFLLTSLLKKTDAIKKDSKKIILEISIPFNSKIANLKVKDIVWPKNSLIVTIKKGETEIVPKGDTIIEISDVLYIVTDSFQVDNVKNEITDLVDSEVY